MSAQNYLNKPLSEVLADLRKQRDELDQAIKVLENIGGIASATGLASGTGSASAVSTTGEDSELQDGAFHGMSIADATKKLLSIRKRKMGNPEIARELATGGLVMNSADPVNTVGSVLTRRFNQVGDIVKVARGTWGLKEWYPNRTFKPSGKPTAPQPEADDEAEELIRNLDERYEARMAEVRGLGLGDDDEKEYDL